MKVVAPSEALGKHFLEWEEKTFPIIKKWNAVSLLIFVNNVDRALLEILILKGWGVFFNLMEQDKC